MWTCPASNGHIQALGRDQAGRRQYIYHKRWKATSAAAKFDRMDLMERVLPRIDGESARTTAACRDAFKSKVYNWGLPIAVRFGYGGTPRRDAKMEEGIFECGDTRGRSRAGSGLLLAGLALVLAACAGSQMTTGIVDNRLAPCPGPPNCVSSDAADETHRVAPYRLKATPEAAWRGLREVVEAQKRITVVTASDDYLHVEVRSPVLRFVDDTEFHLRAADGVIAVRSAARVGYGDLGVNRKRIETIREALRAGGLIE